MLSTGSVGNILSLLANFILIPAVVLSVVIIFRRAIEQVVGEVGIQKYISCHTFRHSFATELLRQSTDI